MAKINKKDLQTAVDVLLKTDFGKTKNMTFDQIKDKVSSLNQGALRDTDVDNVVHAVVKYNDLRNHGKMATITYVPNFKILRSSSVLIDGASSGQVKAITDLMIDGDNKGTYRQYLTPAGETGATDDGRYRFNGSDCYVYGPLSSFNFLGEEDDGKQAQLSAVVVEGKSTPDGLTYDFETLIPIKPLIKSVEQLHTMYSRDSLLYLTKDMLIMKLQSVNSIFPALKDDQLIRSAKIPDDGWPTFDDFQLKKLKNKSVYTGRQKLEPSTATLTVILSRDWRLAGRLGSPSWEPSAQQIINPIHLPSHIIPAGKMTDQARNIIYAYIETTYHFPRMTQTSYNTAIDTVCSKNAFNMFTKWLGQFRGQWDGHKRIELFLHEYFGVPDTPATRDASKIMFVSMAINAMYPGTVRNHTFDLIGGQGIGKTTAFRKLTGSFSDNRPEDEKIKHPNPLAVHQTQPWTVSPKKSRRGLDDLIDDLSHTMVFQDDEMTITNNMSDDELKSFVTDSSQARDVKFHRYRPDTQFTFTIIRTANSHLTGMYTIPYESGGRRFIPLICTPDKNDQPTEKVSNFISKKDPRHILDWHDVSQMWAETMAIIDNSHLDSTSATFISNKTGDAINELSEESQNFFAIIYQDLYRQKSMDEDLIDYITDQYNSTKQTFFTKDELAKKVNDGVLLKDNKTMEKIKWDIELLGMKEARKFTNTQQLQDKINGNNIGYITSHKKVRKRGYEITEATKRICHAGKDDILIPPTGGASHARMILKEAEIEFHQRLAINEQMINDAINVWEAKQEADDWVYAENHDCFVYVKEFSPMLVKHDPTWPGIKTPVIINESENDLGANNYYDGNNEPPFKIDDSITTNTQSN